MAYSDYIRLEVLICFVVNAAQSCRNKKRDRVRKNSPERCISNVPPADISDGKIT